MVMLVDELPREFKTALNKMRSIKQTETFKEKLHSCIWTESGGTAILRRSFKIKDIPACSLWRWNQAKRRFHARFDDGDHIIELMKLVPRKRIRTNTTILPKLKLWQGTIDYVESGYSVTIFWCEKGLDGDSFDEELNIEDYTFLAKFMNESLCRELWPQLRMCGSFDTSYNTVKWEGYLPNL